MFWQVEVQAMRILIYGFLMLFWLGAPAFAADTRGFVSHHATYELDLWDSGFDSTVLAVHGKSLYAVHRHCHGWERIEKFITDYSFASGDSHRFTAQIDAWESHKGNQLSFVSRELSSNNGAQNFEGYVNLFADDAGEAVFIGDDDGRVALPKNTHLPMQHLALLLEQARGNKRLYQSHLFIGGALDDSWYFVSALIGKRQTASPEIDLGVLATPHYWPFRLAYFTPDTPNPIDAEPQYEIEFNMQENGIIRSYIVDYGDFSVRGRMKDFALLNEEDC